MRQTKINRRNDFKAVCGRRIWAWLLAAACVIGGLAPLQPVHAASGVKQVAPAAAILTSNMGDIAVETLNHLTTAGQYTVRQYQYETGDRFRSVRFQPQGRGSSCLQTLYLEADEGEIRYFSEGEWHHQPLQTGLYRAGMYFLTAGDQSVIVSLPRCYQDRANDCIEAIPDSDGFMTVTKVGTGFLVRLMVPPAPAESYFTYYLLEGGASLIDWSRSDAQAQWSNYQMEGDNRWTDRGYYYTAPYNYIPTGENYFHRIPVSYIPIKMLDCPDLAARELAIPMLHVMLELQNARGYFPTRAGSEWLLNDYEISANFYDTRFSTDMAAGLLSAYQAYGIDAFWEAAKRYGDFLLWYAQQTHRIYTNEQTRESGWLLGDYWDPDGNQPVHTSLNHQLCETLFLYRMEHITGDVSYGEAADQMLAGLTAVGTDWLQPDGNLWYSMEADGTMGGTEYPYLTYNDLYDLQKMLEICRDGRDPVLQKLMDSKLQWMQANGIEGYKQD